MSFPVPATGTQAASDDKQCGQMGPGDRKSTRLNSSHSQISYAVFCLKHDNAKSGQFLKRIDLIKRGKASVFLANPVETPQPAARDFPPASIPPTPTATSKARCSRATT